MLKIALPSFRSLPADWLQDCNSVLASAICHLTGLLLLGVLTLASPGNWGDAPLQVELGDGSGGSAGGSPIGDDVGKFAAATDDVEAALAAGPTQVFDTPLANVSDVGALESPLDALPASSGLDGQSIGDMAMLGGGGGGGGAGGIGDGSGTGVGSGSGSGGSEFFGIGGRGGSFVYVVDVSGSMNEDGKFERARAELLRSIEHLTEDQKYYIIFYNDGWYPMDADHPVRATARQLDRTRRWVSHVFPGGGTYPLDALLRALSLEPDAIYFLSDGRFDPAVIDALRVQDPPSYGQIPIHTIAFVNQETIGTMKMIAKNSGGKFRFVQ